ncbi:EpsG family protein [Photobacterium sp.]|uniref:EpsG family protein n=1 Tax=Photobacterium sp. TaxID=660 RepID=UPI00299D0673|nr:EpsG family protein [Photobacterium sp.]MDX1303674.1 EpsG family protein [Photobacterium sp.]
MDNIFFILILILGLMSSLYRVEHSSRIITPLLFVITISFFIGFRSEFSGVDTQTYIKIFYQAVESNELVLNYELFFSLIIYLSSQFLSVEMYLFFIAFFSFLGLLIAARMLNLSNATVFIVVFLAFLPGLDLVTNGIRNGLSLTLGLPFFVYAMIVNKSKRLIPKLINITPVFFHYSYIPIFFMGFISRKLINYKLSIILILISIVFFTTWIIIPADLIQGIARPYTSLPDPFGKLARYIILEKQIMSEGVKAYFYVVSLLLTLITAIPLLSQPHTAKKDDRYNRLFFISSLGIMVYSSVYFMGFSYRFMFLFYPIQILAFTYVWDKYVTNQLTRIIIVAFIILNFLVTYSTSTFTEMDLLFVY